MALDKQKILSELGNVMNQLQSADCGCMNKLFNPGQECVSKTNPLPTCGGCRRGSCSGHGYGAHYNNMSGSGEAYGMHGGNMSGMNGGNMSGMHEGSMSGVQEHNMSSTHEGNMGGMNISHAGGTHGSHMGGTYGDNMSRMRGAPSGGMHGGNMNDTQSGMQRGRMGCQTCLSEGNMDSLRNIPKIYSDTNNYLNQNLIQETIKEVYDDLKDINPNNTIGNNPLAAQMGLHPGSAGAMVNPYATQNPAATPITGSEIVNMMSGARGKPSTMPTGQLKEPILKDALSLPHGQLGLTPLHTSGKMSMGNEVPNMAYQHVNPTAQGMTNAEMMNARLPNARVMKAEMTNAGIEKRMMSPKPQSYGPHAAGIQKFHEMFPGTEPGGLSFDPMAIAVQMNPANQKGAAMHSINNVMNGKNPGQAQRNVVAPNQLTNQRMTPSQNIPLTGQVGNQQPMQGQIAIPGAGMQPNGQLVYPVQSGAPMMNQLPVLELKDPNTGIVATPGYRQGGADPNAQMLQQHQDINSATRRHMDPIFPVDRSRNTYMLPDYNTLGQPIQRLPGSLYNKPQPGLPQTLHGAYAGRDYDVKNTKSKTSIARTMPVGKSASKSQLQHIYRQYRASHSDVQQSIKPPFQRDIYWEGNYPARNKNLVPSNQMPVDKVGGDGLANSYQPECKVEPTMGETGDILRDPGDYLYAQTNGAIMQKRGRNGLQDKSYRPYLSKAAWTFHG